MSAQDIYDAVNRAWPAPIPPLTAVEARRASRALARHFGGRPRREPRRCWIARRPPFDDLRRGWRRLVHDVAHRTFRQTNRRIARGHGGWHAELELKMVQYVVARGWLSGSLASVKAPPATNTDKLDAVRAGIARWTTKKKRAETALAKLRRRERYYLRKEERL